VFPGSFNDQKGSIHFNINSNSSNQKFKMQFSGIYMLDNNQLLNTDLTQLAVWTVPVAPALYNSDGSLNWAPNSTGNSTWNNPLSELLKPYKNKTSNLVGNLVLNYEVLPGLEVKSSLGYTNLLTNDYSATPLIYNKPENRPTSTRTARYGNRQLSSYIFEPQMRYKTTIQGGKLDILVGATIQQSNSEGGNVLGRGYNSDQVLENKAAASQLTPGTQFSIQYKYNAAFGRINYIWKEKYIIDLTGRRDGTSRFGNINQFHNFWSIGSAWVFTNEQWLQKQKVLSFGKIRVNYGTTGSDQIGDYAFMSLYNFWGSPGLPYQNTSGIYPAGLPNPYLQWEETKKLQIGIDLGLFSERIFFSSTYGLNQTSNQLLSYSLPSIAGYTFFNRNFPAKVQNTTWEFALNSTNIINKSFKWLTNVNLTVPKNKLKSFPGLEASSYATSLFVGKPLGLTRTFPFAGVNTSTGEYQYLDSQRNVTSSPSYPQDASVLINYFPKFYGGIENSFNYKGIELDFLFQFTKQVGGNYLYTSQFQPGMFVAGFGNQPVSVLNRWQKPGDQAKIAKYSSLTYYDIGENGFSDASFIRLKNVSLSYYLPSKWKKIGNFKSGKIYLQGENLWTITNWDGLNPETKSNFSLPPLRVFVIGLQVGF
jgi:hypothetical protein